MTDSRLDSLRTVRQKDRDTLRAKLARAGELVGALLFLCVSCRCAEVIHLSVQVPNVGVSAPINLKLGVYISDQELERVDSYGPNRVRTGEALGTATYSCFGQIFAGVQRVSSETDFGSQNVDLIVAPTIKDFYLTPLSNAGLLLECRILDRTGRVVYHGIVSGRGESREKRDALLRPPPGTELESASKENYLADASRRAFVSAFRELAVDVTAATDFAPYLKK